MAEHKLKTCPVYFEAVKSGAKNFEVRRDDRGFQKGDILVLEKFEPGYGYHRDPGNGLKPHKIRRRATWILTGGQLGIEPGYVVMGLEPEPSAVASTE